MILSFSVLRFALRLISVSIVMILLARLSGASGSPSPLLSIMSTTDGAVCDHPCLFGIQPGVTSIDEALLILQNHPLTHDATWQNNHTLQLAGSSTYIAFSQTPEGMVDSIVVTDDLSDSGISVPESLVDASALGDLMLAFGVSSVYLPGSSYIVINIPSVGITAAIARPEDLNTKIQADMPLSTFMISVIRPCPTTGQVMLSVHRWIGFTTLGRYYRDRRTYTILKRISGVPVPPNAPCQQ